MLTESENVITTPPSREAVRLGLPFGARIESRLPLRKNIEGASREPTLLIAASRFPPAASVGAIRIAKFVKYLGRFGWRCVVITGAARRSNQSSQAASRATDDTGLRDLPRNVPVHRLSAAVDDWPAAVARSWGQVLGRITRPFGIDPRHWRAALHWRFRSLHDRISFPDRNVWRLPAVAKLALKLDREHHFDAILTSGMPFSDLLVGLALRKLLKRPWVADFRDPWLEYIHWPQWRSPLGRRLTRAAERAVMRNATWITSVNDQMADRFAARYGESVGAKCITIPNGFDESDFPGSRAESENACFQILYAGSLYGARSPERILEAFKRFLANTPGARERVRFDFAGRAGPFAVLLGSLKAELPVEYLGFLSHAETLHRMASADANVILLPNQPGSENDSTAKLYECLGSRRAILAAVPAHGAAAQTLRGFEGVWLRAPDDVEGLESAIRDMYHRWRAGVLHSFNRPLKNHTREHQTCRLAEYLNHAIERANAPIGRGP